MEEFANSFQNNYEETQKAALNTVINHHMVAVLNSLRGITIPKCYKALCRLDRLYGNGLTHEKYICLAGITDYISCAWYSDGFYDTFTSKNKITSRRLIFSLFNRLTEEWLKLFNRSIYKILSKHQVESAVNLLRSSILRFPLDSEYGIMLSPALKLGEKTLTMYKCEEISIKNKYEDVPFHPVKLSEENNMELASKIFPVQEKRSTNQLEKHKPDIRMYTELIPRKIGSLGANEPIRKPLKNINNVSVDEMGSYNSNVTSQKLSPKKVVNAFDVLMRRKTLKRKSM